MKSYSNLTVSKLYGTWQKLHPEMEAVRAESYRWQQSSQPSTAMPPRATVSSQTEDDEEYLRLLKVKEEALRMSGSNQQETSFVTSAPHKQTEAEQERNSAIYYAVKSIRELVNTPFRTDFYPYDLENLLPEGIVAKAIDMGQEAGSSFSESNLT